MRRLLAVLVSWVRDTFAFLWAAPLAFAVVGASGVGGAAAGVPVGEKLFDYMWRDPVFCGDCHVHDYANEAWARSVHGQLTTCHDCHRVPIRHYPRNLFVTVFQRPQTPEDVPSAHVGAVLCEQCHSEKGAEEPLTGPMPSELREHVVKVDDSPLHRAHLDAKTRAPSRYHGGGAPVDAGGATGAEAHGGEAEASIVCLDCHGGKDLRVHRFSADSNDCVTCHEGIAPRDEHGDALSCLDCHGRGFVGAGSDPDALQPGRE